MYSMQAAVMQSRVLAGLIKVNPPVLPQYNRRFSVKPAGDTDVIEKQQMIQSMMQTWEVMKGTAAGPIFLTDMLEKMYPDNAAKYVQALQAAAQQQQSQQAQQMQAMMQQVKLMAGGIVKLAENPAMFSEQGLVHAFPIVEHFADMIKEFKEKQGKAGGQ